jgi:hypothetical protein
LSPIPPTFYKSTAEYICGGFFDLIEDCYYGEEVATIPIELYEVILSGDWQRNPDLTGIILEISFVSKVVLV